MPTARRVTAMPAGRDLPQEAQPRQLRRRGLQTLALLGVLVAVVVLAPGLGEARKHLNHADAGWLALAVGLEALSCWSYVLAFRPVFCRHMSWRSATEIGWAELGMGSIVPASGAGGLALGAWILRRGGMPTDQIARRSVAFFLLKSSVNFAAVAVIGGLLAVGLIGPDQPLWRTALPAVLALVVIVAVVALGRLPGPPASPPETEGARRLWTEVRRALVG